MTNKTHSEAVSKLVDVLAQSAPSIEPSPFFASRIACLALSERPTLVMSFQRVARRMVPIFFGLVIVTSLLLFQAATAQEPAVPYSELLLEKSEPAVPITLEYVLTSVGPFTEER